MPADVQMQVFCSGHALGCECGNCCHARYGCLVCGDQTGACTPTLCMGEERGVCMNCGGDMDFSPMHPWCPDCSESE